MEFEPVMDIIWKLSFDVIPFDDYSFFRRQKNRDNLRDWKKVIKIYKKNSEVWNKVISG